MIVHTFGDGFLHPHQFIKWPQILKMLSDNIILKLKKKENLNVLYFLG